MKTAIGRKVVSGLRQRLSIQSYQERGIYAMLRWSVYPVRCESYFNFVLADD